MSVQGSQGKVSQPSNRKIKDMSQFERLPFGYQAGHPTKARMRSPSYGLQDRISLRDRPVHTGLGDSGS